VAPSRSPTRAREALQEFARLLAGAKHAPEIRWLTVAGNMGFGALAAANCARVEIVHTPVGEALTEDTRAASRKFVAAGVDLALFCGGDGTARDICAITGRALIKLNES